MVCETDMMIGAANFYFGKHGEEMKRNFEEGFKIFHDLMYKLNNDKRVEEEYTNQETLKAINIINKNSRIFAHYLVGKSLESPKNEGAEIDETEYFLYPTPQQFAPYDIDSSSGVTKYKVRTK